MISSARAVLSSVMRRDPRILLYHSCCSLSRASSSLLISKPFHQEGPLQNIVRMSHYAERYNNSQGQGDQRPTALEIVQDEGLTGKLKDKVFLVTGVSSGIGIETMRSLYATGAHVFGTVRNREKGEKVVEDAEAKTEGGKITLIEMEMDSLESIRKGAGKFLSMSKTLNVLINNAGYELWSTMVYRADGVTRSNGNSRGQNQRREPRPNIPFSSNTNADGVQQGFETQFGVCHVGHFYLFQLLRDALLQSSTREMPSRVVVVASYGHRTAPPRFDDYKFEEPDSYNPWTAYGQAMTANIWFSNELECRYGARGLHSTSLHPGGIHSGLSAQLDQSGWADAKVQAYMKSPEQGAATSIYAALSGLFVKTSGSAAWNASEYLQHIQPTAVTKIYSPLALSDAIAMPVKSNNSVPLRMTKAPYPSLSAFMIHPDMLKNKKS